jgi:hypothetical protein
VLTPALLGAVSDQAGVVPLTAFGGIITQYTDSGTTYRVHAFRGSGKFHVSSGAAAVDWVLVAGGGGTGVGGGGAGGVLGSIAGASGATVASGAYSVSAGTYTIVVGAGGTGGNTSDSGVTDGADSTAFGYTAVGGGRNAGGAGQTGGSGGGGYPGSAAGGGTCEVRATTARLVGLAVAVAVATLRQAGPTLRDRVAMALCTGGSRRPLSAMRAVVAQETTTREFSRLVACTAVATAATTTIMLKQVCQTRAVEQAVVTLLVSRIPVGKVAQESV